MTAWLVISHVHLDPSCSVVPLDKTCQLNTTLDFQSSPVSVAYLSDGFLLYYFGEAKIRLFLGCLINHFIQDTINNKLKSNLIEYIPCWMSVKDKRLKQGIEDIFIL